MRSIRECLQRSCSHQEPYELSRRELVEAHFHPEPVPPFNPETPELHRKHPLPSSDGLVPLAVSFSIHVYTITTLMACRQVPLELHDDSCCLNCRAQFPGYDCIRTYKFAKKQSGTPPCDACRILDAHCQFNAEGAQPSPSRAEGSGQSARHRASIAPVTVSPRNVGSRRSEFRARAGSSSHASLIFCASPQPQSLPGSERAAHLARIAALEQRSSAAEARLEYLEAVVTSLRSSGSSAD